MTIANDLQRSNSTTAAFLGGKPKEWMSGSIASSLSRVSAISTSSDQSPPAYPTTRIAPQVSAGHLSNDPDRGCFPLDRKRRGGTKAYPSRRSAPGDFKSASPISPVTEEHRPALVSETGVETATNSLPTPSPSIETRRHSSNIIDLGDETSDLRSAGQESRSRLEELVAQYGSIDAVEKELQAIKDKDSSAPTPQPTVSESRAPQPNSFNSYPQGQHQQPFETQPTMSHAASADSRTISATNKRQSEGVGRMPESRKRQESLPNSFTASHVPSTSLNDGVRHDTMTSSFRTEMQEWHQKISHRLFSLNVNGPGYDVERPRLELLREACENSDYFYLRLHQLYCIKDAHRRSRTPFVLLEETCLKGLDKISDLLISNENLSANAIMWFSIFPLPLEHPSRERLPFQAAHQQVVNCLKRIDSNWNIMRSQCSNRGFPPLYQELAGFLGVESVTAQQIIFRSVLRDIWKSPHDECLRAAEELFPKHREEMLELLRVDPADTERTRNDRMQYFILTFNKVVTAHQQHLQVDAQRRPPQINQDIRHHNVNATLQTPAVGPFMTNGKGPPNQPAQDIRQVPPNAVIHPPPSSSYPTGSLQPQRLQGSYVPPTVASNIQARDVQRSQPDIRPHHQQSVRYQRPLDSNNRQVLHQSNGYNRGSRPQAVKAIPSQVSTNVPFVRANPNLKNTQIDPAWHSLHQAHVRSPVLSLTTPQNNNQNVKLFSYIASVILPPRELGSLRKHVSWRFNIDKEIFVSLAEDTASAIIGSPPCRSFGPESKFCRIRCVKVSEPFGLLNQGTWVTADTIWPGSPAVILNDKALEIRKKSHHGKDLPIDATRYIKEGTNSLSTAIIGLPEGSLTTFGIGVEIIQVTSEQSIKENIPTIPMQEALKRSTDRCGNNDPDVEIVNAQVVLDLTDPFTAKIFDIPVRGKCCRHSQCFDRDIFLQTRKSKHPKEPCGPDEFRCPICGADARPQSLIIDGFFMQVREELQRKGRLDIKAIILYQSGVWEIKEEESTREQSDSSGERIARARSSVKRMSTPRDVVELDD